MPDAIETKVKLPQAKPVMTSTDVLELIPIDLSTLHRWTKSGKFPKPIAGGQGTKTLWSRREVEAWTNGTQQEPGMFIVGKDESETVEVPATFFTLAYFTHKSLKDYCKTLGIPPGVTKEVTIRAIMATERATICASLGD